MKAIPLEKEADLVLQSEETVKSTANYLPVTQCFRRNLWLYAYMGQTWEQYNQF